MESPEIKWEQYPHQYGPPEWRAMIGQWAVGSVTDRIVSRSEPLSYSANCGLPGLKPRLGSYSTEDKARQRVERAVAYWFQNLILAEVANETGN